MEMLRKLVDLDAREWLDAQLQALVTVAVGHRRSGRLQLSFTIKPAMVKSQAYVIMRLRSTVQGCNPQHHNRGLQWYITQEGEVIRADERQMALVPTEAVGIEQEPVGPIDG